MPVPPFKITLLLVLVSCSGTVADTQLLPIVSRAAKQQSISQQYATVAQIPLPAGFKRVAADSNSFAAWLRNLPLKKNNTVYLFNGQPKQNQAAQFAVLDITVGKTDLQQCADAVMRLRAEYLFKQQAFTLISFTDNAGKVYLFKPPYNRQNFDSYLNLVFNWCGTASLAKQLVPVNIHSMEPGDVFVHPGFPGHAEIILDMATDIDGDKVYLLAQSYMPAQDIHVLKDPANKSLSPWYQLGEEEVIETPEYSFTKDELKKW